MSNTTKQRSYLWWYGIVLIIVGLALWFVSISDQVMIAFLNTISANDLSTIEERGRLTAAFTLGIGGAASIGWGFTLMAGSLNFTRQTRSYITTGVIIWFVFDSVSSLLHQFYLNIVSNIIFLVSALFVLFTTEIKNLYEE